LFVFEGAVWIKFEKSLFRFIFLFDQVDQVRKTFMFLKYES
jgi:hypothetical protein